jgi:hypothetical protein
MKLLATLLFLPALGFSQITVKAISAYPKADSLGDSDRVLIQRCNPDTNNVCQWGPVTYRGAVKSKFGGGVPGDTVKAWISDSIAAHPGGGVPGDTVKAWISDSIAAHPGGGAPVGYQSCGNADCTIADTTQLAAFTTLTANRNVTCSNRGAYMRPIRFRWNILAGFAITFTGCTINGVTTYTTAGMPDSTGFTIEPITATTYSLRVSP